MDRLHGAPTDFSLLSKVLTLMELLPSVPFAVNLWQVQNVYFEMAKAIYAEMFSKAKAGDQDVVKWVESFKQIGQALSFNIATVLPET
jgi:hypothetical protein